MCSSICTEETFILSRKNRKTKNKTQKRRENCTRFLKRQLSWIVKYGGDATMMDLCRVPILGSPKALMNSNPINHQKAQYNWIHSKMVRYLLSSSNCHQTVWLILPSCKKINVHDINSTFYHHIISVCHWGGSIKRGSTAIKLRVKNNNSSCITLCIQNNFQVTLPPKFLPSGPDLWTSVLLKSKLASTIYQSSTKITIQGWYSLVCYFCMWKRL